MPHPRLTGTQRRSALVEAGAAQFAALPYEAVHMDEIARRAGVSRALLYRHFPSKRDLFAAVYQAAADELVEATDVGSGAPLLEQVRIGLEAHVDYFLANRNAVIAANRVLAGDPVIQSIIDGELAALGARLAQADELQGRSPEAARIVLVSWLAFVRVLAVQWLEHEPFGRRRLVDVCLGALGPALDAAVGTGDGAA